MRISRASAAAFWGVLVLVPARPAFGSRTYPAVVQDALHMPCAPQCTLCHRDLNGGLGTAVTPFGTSLRAHDAVSQEPDSVRAALLAMDADGTDSDGDGVPDITELRQGQSPNVKGGQSLCGPTYGCGARVEPAGSLDGFAVLAAALAALGLAGARRRRALSRRRNREPLP